MARFSITKAAAYLFLLLATNAGGQNAKQYVQQAVDTELTADRNDHSCWLYRDSDQKPAISVLQWVAETNRGEVKRILKRNGRPLSSAEQRQMIEGFVRNPSAQAKQRHDNQNDDQQAKAMLRLLPEAFVWTIADRNSKSAILHFVPSPHFNPPTREARVFAAMEGEMTVDAEQHRIQSRRTRRFRRSRSFVNRPCIQLRRKTASSVPKPAMQTSSLEVVKPCEPTGPVASRFLASVRALRASPQSPSADRRLTAHGPFRASP